MRSVACEASGRVGSSVAWVVALAWSSVASIPQSSVRPSGARGCHPTQLIPGR